MVLRYVQCDGVTKDHNSQRKRKAELVMVLYRLLQRDAVYELLYRLVYRVVIRLFLSFCIIVCALSCILLFMLHSCVLN